jgi:hypothetical protein
VDEAVLGKRLWGPDEAFDARARRIERNVQLLGFVFLGLGLAFFVQGALMAGPGAYEVATGVSAVGAVLVVFGVVVVRQSMRRQGIALGVFEGGLLLPSSFENVPGLETLGGPVVIRRRDIDRVEEMRKGQDWAIVVWSKGGPSGVAPSRFEGKDMDAAQARAMLESFKDAMAGAGFPVPQRKDQKVSAEEE